MFRNGEVGVVRWVAQNLSEIGFGEVCKPIALGDGNVGHFVGDRVFLRIFHGRFVSVQHVNLVLADQLRKVDADDSTAAAQVQYFVFRSYLDTLQHRSRAVIQSPGRKQFRRGFQLQFDLIDLYAELIRCHGAKNGFHWVREACPVSFGRDE